MLLDRVWQEWKPLEIDITAVSEDRTHFQPRCWLSTVAPDPWSRAAGFHGHGRGHWQWLSVSQGARVCRLARTGAATALHRGQGKLYGISKRGNVYLRRMSIHGARAVLLRVKYGTGGFNGCSRWKREHPVPR